ncbi:polyprenyl synthetase family protein [Gorillibacterium sp. sgz5001074]|uniref:polyprenyl synthetase family protein n=1 Tax=Gorillibacterium sp. sgz5001074 TaxID=3446695 RepID=UPI003F66646D
MDPRVIDECKVLLDRCVPNQELRRLLGVFLDDKCSEPTIWSTLTLQTHFMLGGDSGQIYRNAALTELMMLAYDIADDLQDRDNPSKSWMACPPEMTLNALLALHAVFMESAPPSVLPEAAKLLSLSISGQHTDLEGTAETEQDVLDMVSRKSGSLIRFACLMGYSLIPGLESAKQEQLDQLASLIGVIAQLDNDLRDAIRMDEKSDVLLKKRTLPLLFALETAEQDCLALSDYYSGRMDRDTFERHRPEVLEFIQQSGSIEYSRVIQALHIDHADRLFQQLDALSPWKEAFRNAAYAPRGDANENTKEEV